MRRYHALFVLVFVGAALGCNGAESTSALSGPAVSDRTSALEVSIAAQPHAVDGHEDDGSQALPQDERVGSPTDFAWFAFASDSSASSSGGATNSDPEIEGIRFDFGADGSLTFTVDATDPNGLALSFAYSGFGIAGSLAGDDTLTLSPGDVADAAATLPEGDGATLDVVVQDSSGASAAASLTIDISALLTGSGTATSTPAPTFDPCVAADAACGGACDADELAGLLDAAGADACHADCDAALAACEP